MIIYHHLSVDIDECQDIVCGDPIAALCNNINGSYVCTCRNGFSGNGTNCEGTCLSLHGMQ